MISLTKTALKIFSTVENIHIGTCSVCINVGIRRFHLNHASQDKLRDQRTYQMVSFKNVNDKRKDTYLEVLREYTKNNIYRRGHVEFILIALKYMEEFNVHHDLESYKKLLDLLPKGPYIPQGWFQAMLFHAPKQQDVACRVLQQMEDNGVIPDAEVHTILINTFGIHATPLKKFGRMMYWMPKLSNINPWPVPKPCPTDPRILAWYAMKKMSSIDSRSEIIEFETKDVKDSVDDTWGIYAISLTQIELLNNHSLEKPVFVEGPYTVWVRDKMVDYFVLKGDPIKKNMVYRDEDDTSIITIPFWEVQDEAKEYTVHETDDGVIFGLCATGTSTKDSLLSWIRYMQKEIPVLEKIPIVFKIRSTYERPLEIEEGLKDEIITSADNRS